MELAVLEGMSATPVTRVTIPRPHGGKLVGPHQGQGPAGGSAGVVGSTVGALVSEDGVGVAALLKPKLDAPRACRMLWVLFRSLEAVPLVYILIVVEDAHMQFVASRIQEPEVGAVLALEVVQLLTAALHYFDIALPIPGVHGPAYLVVDAEVARPRGEIPLNCCSSYRLGSLACSA